MAYFAEFRNHAGAVFRLDTRIYLRDGDGPRIGDVCVGAIVAKNPGSAGSTTFGTLQPLELRNDKLLPFVRNRFIADYRHAGKAVPAGA